MSITEMSQKVDSKAVCLKILDDYDYFIFDCDGVLWLGNQLLPNTVETLALLKAKGKTVLFVTNNSTKSRDSYLKKFEKFGISGITKDEVFCSSYAVAVYVSKILELPKDKKLWVLGEEGVQEELKEIGYDTVGGTDPSLVADGVDFDGHHPMLTSLDQDVGAVVAGLCLSLNYLKLSITLQYLLKDNKSIPFIATNIDSTFPSENKLLIGAGSIIETVSFASSRKPDAVCGKPNQAMMNAIKSIHPGLSKNPKRGLMVGDRLNTDMKFGRDGGLDTLLVLTGIETEQNVLDQSPDTAPSYYATKLSDIYELTK